MNRINSKKNSTTNEKKDIYKKNHATHSTFDEWNGVSEQKKDAASRKRRAKTNFQGLQITIQGILCAKLFEGFHLYCKKK